MTSSNDFNNRLFFVNAASILSDFTGWGIDAICTETSLTLIPPLMLSSFGFFSSPFARVVNDDRDISPGMKLKDADLIGFPIRVIVGMKYKREGLLEIKIRKTGEVITAKRHELLDKLLMINDQLMPK